MRDFILQRLMVLVLLIVINTVNAQPGSGWDWAATSTKATPAPGRQIRDIVTDAGGNVYAVGDFAGTMTMGSVTLTTTGDGSVNFNYDFDAFVVKYNATGTVLWAKQFGTAGLAANERGEVINIDGSGNVYIGGNSGAPFLVKYDNDGNLLWNKSFTLYDLGGINFGPDNNPIIMESNQGSKNIHKIDKANGNILWTVSNTGVGSNSTSTFQDFVDQAGNVYFTAFRINGGAVTVAGNSYSPTQTTTYIASVDNNGSTRWVDVLSNVQVQLSYTIDKNGKSYVTIGGGFGSSFQGVAISGTPANGNTYLELNSSGTLVSYKSLSPFKALMRVTDNGIYSYGVNAGSSFGSYTEVYGNNIIKSRAGTGNDLGVIIKYDLNTYQPLWANSYEANGSNYLNTIETAANGKCLAAGAYQTSVKFGASLYTPTTVGTASFAFDFFVAQFNPANVAPSPTTTWTGNSNNGNWNDAGNWSNGAPNGNEKSIIPTGISNYPINITTANSTGKLTVGNSVSIALPVGFDAPVGIVNDGSIEVKGTGTFQGFNTSYVNYLSGSGKLVFTANSPSAILYNINNSLEVNKPGGTIQWNGGTISGSVSLTAGILDGAFPIVLTDPNATITYSSTGYMNGTLKRAVNSSGTYVFPMGNSGLYAPVTLTLNNITGTQNISITFPESFAQTAGTTPNINLGGKTITSKLNNNQWVITPDVALTGGDYAIALQAGKYTNGVTDASRYVIIKRPDNTTPWGFEGINGTSTQTGGTINNGVVSNGTVNATSTGLTGFSTFGIGVASASVPPGTAIITSNWTGNGGNTTWNNAANWDNGIPSGLVNAIIPAGRPVYPQVYTVADNARSLQIDANASIKLPYNFITNANILNNGSVEVTGLSTATFNGFGTSVNGYAPLSGSGKLSFTNNSPGIFSGTFNNSIEVNRTTNYLYAQNVYVGGSFNIITGNVFTSYLGNETFITMLSPAAMVTAPATYPVQGTLNRTVNASGTYNYPIGEGPSRYAPVIITTNNLAATTRMSAQYYSTIYGFHSFLPADGQPVSALNAGQWTITPNAPATAGTFNITLEATGYTNGITDVSRYVLLRSNGITNWEKVDNTVITESAGVITAVANNQAALTAQTVYIIGIKGLTTQWTGSANNQSWATATNWTNGTPDNSTKAVFIAGSPNYPVSITTANTSAMLDIASGVSLKLPQNFSIPQGIINNGTIEVIGTNPFAGFAGGTPLSGTGKLLFSSASPAGFSSGLTIIDHGVEINRTGNFTANTITINGSLTLTSGLMAGNITLGNPAAALTYTPTSYIVGTLKRTISSPGIYTFPIGAADRFALVTLNINSITGTQNIAAAFTSTINGAVPNTTAQGVPVTELLNSGIWTITPNTQPTALSYTITLEGRNHTNGVTDAARYVVLRRDASYYAWGFYGNNGLATQNAGVVNATGSMTGFFREYGIGIASSGVGNVLPLNLISFTAIKKDANVLLQWKTTNEVNTKQALIQHSTDAITWTPIGRIASNNNSVNNYSFLHTQPANGTNYYRLLLQDLNGNSTFSDIRRINLDTKVMLRAYPNPVLNNGLTIDVGQFIDKALNYLVLDYAGRIVKTGKIENQQQHILLQDLLPGMYLLKVSNGTVIKFEKK